MPSRRLSAPAVFASAVFALSLVLIGCEGKTEGSSDSATPEAGPGVLTATPAMDATLEAITAAALWKYVDTTLDFGHSSSTAGFRNLATRSGTCGNVTDVRVNILPEKDAHELAIADIGVDPRIIAKIIVPIRNCVVDQWGFAGEKASYWVVDKPAGATEVRSRFVAIDKTGWAPLTDPNAPAQYFFRPCQGRETEHTGSVAKLIRGRNHTEACAAAHLAPTPADTLHLMTGDASAWISCLAGCCTANST